MLALITRSRAARNRRAISYAAGRQRDLVREIIALPDTVFNLGRRSLRHAAATLSNCRSIRTRLRGCRNLKLIPSRRSSILLILPAVHSRGRIKSARGSARWSAAHACTTFCAFLPSGSLLTCDGKKARPRCIVKLAHRKQSCHSAARSRGRQSRQAENRNKKKNRMGRRAQRVQDSPRPSRCAL